MKRKKRQNNFLNFRLYNRFLRTAIRQAGARYTPGIKVDAPNLQIKELVAAFDGIARNTVFREKICKIHSQFSAKRKEYRMLLTAEIDVVVKNRKILTKYLLNLGKTLSKIRKIRTDLYKQIPFEKIRNITSKLLDILSKIDLALYSELSKVNKQSKDKKKHDEEQYLRTLLHITHETRVLIHEIHEFSGSTAAKLANNPRGLLLGEWGTGKTHLFCDIAKHRIAKRLPTIIILGHQFHDVDNPLKQVIHLLKLSCTERQFLSELNKQGLKNKTRALILIDAINEGDRNGWRRNLTFFLDKLSKYHGIGIIISCRTPFEKIIVKKKDFQSFVIFYHLGFADRESKAQFEFFRFYKIPNPEVPLLTYEFSRPLFLKLFCEALEKTTVQRKHKQIEDIAAGLRGMTYVFEYFIDQKAKIIEKKLSLNNGTCWNEIKKMAITMAQNRTDCIQEVVCKADLKKIHQKLFKELILEGLISEDVVWPKNRRKCLSVVRFPYQKFSDHLIVRSLLKNIQQKADSKILKKCFLKRTTLGYFFKDDVTINRYSGIIESMIIEFPNRIKSRGELFDYLPIDVTYTLAELFISGLVWRSISSINKSTNKWVNTFLNNGRTHDNILDKLIILAVKPKHPYNGFALHNYFKKMKMPERDLVWSEFLRNQVSSASIYRILDWIEGNKHLIFSEDFAKTYIIVLMWILATTVRKLRDRVTRAIYKIGLHYPHIVFELTKISFKLNDPYIPERMLAACYGITMALHCNLDEVEFRNSLLPKFAKDLYKLMFKKGAKYSTTHILRRDYARYTIKIALLHHRNIIGISQRKRICPPFRDGGIRRWRVEKDRNEKEYRNGNNPFGMDFAHYTLGRLISNRQNYDFNNPEYQKVKGNMWWRIYNLGYSLEEFGDIDKEIANRNWQRFGRETDGGKADRYGKKYCWIAFYELAGYRKDKGLLKESWQSEHGRISDCDIDPSFPNRPQELKVIKTRYLGGKTKNLDRWINAGPIPNVSKYLTITSVNNIKGPWVLLGGTVSQESYHLKKGVSIFPKVFLIKNDDLSFFRKFRQWISPEHRLPDIIEIYYTFAGEIPWCNTMPYYNRPLYITTVITRKDYTIPKKYVKIVKRRPFNLPKKYLKKLQQIFDDGKQGITDFVHKKNQEATEEISVNVPVEIPICYFNWEGHHSLVNISQSVLVPSKGLANRLKLSIDTRSFKTFTKNGQVASVTTKWGDLWHNGQKLIYLRKDLLEKYLKKKNMTLVWIIEGERNIKLKNYDKHTLRFKRLYKRFNRIVFYLDIIKDKT